MIYSLPGINLGFMAFIQLYKAFMILAATLRLFLPAHAATRRHQDALLYYLVATHVGIHGHTRRKSGVHGDEA